MQREITLNYFFILSHVSVYVDYDGIKANITDETMCGIKNIIQNKGIYTHVSYKYFTTMHIPGVCPKCKDKLK